MAVAEDLHFTKAADRLHVVQSALSTQVKQLEAQLGARLLARRKRSAVALTEPGVLFLVVKSDRWNPSGACLQGNCGVSGADPLQS